MAAEQGLTQNKLVSTFVIMSTADLDIALDTQKVLIRINSPFVLFLSWYLMTIRKTYNIAKMIL